MFSKPTEAEIEKVMKEWGFDRLVAYRHVQQRIWLRERNNRR